MAIHRLFVIMMVVAMIFALVACNGVMLNRRFSLSPLQQRLQTALHILTSPTYLGLSIRLIGDWSYHK